MQHVPVSSILSSTQHMPAFTKLRVKVIEMKGEKPLDYDQMLFHSTTAAHGSFFIHVFKTQGTLIARVMCFRVNNISALIPIYPFFFVLAPFSQRPSQRQIFFCVAMETVWASRTYDIMETKTRT